MKKHPAVDDRQGAFVTDPISLLYPEVRAGGFTRVDGSIAFYTRVAALLAEIGPEAVVVDYGAGRGARGNDPVLYRQQLQELSRYASQVIGVDVDAAVLQNPTVHRAIVIGEKEPLPLDDGSVDLVVSDWTFEHVRDPGHVAAELTRVLKGGGWICARTPNRWGYIALGARLIPNRFHAVVLRQLQPGKPQEDTFPTVYRLNTLSDLKEWFPTTRYEHFVYTSDSEPVYVGRSFWAARLSRLAFGLTPSEFRSILNVFLRKRVDAM